MFKGPDTIQNGHDDQTFLKTRYYDNEHDITRVILYITKSKFEYAHTY